MSGDKKVVLIETDGDRSKELVDMMVAASKMKSPPIIFCGDQMDHYSSSAHPEKPVLEPGTKFIFAADIHSREIDTSAPVDWPAALKRIREYADAGLEAHEPIQIAMPDIHGHSHEFDEEIKRMFKEMPAAFGIPPELFYGDKADSVMGTSVSVRDLKVARLKMLGIDKDVSDLTDEQLNVFLKVIEGYKAGERCKCGARAEYYTNDGFVCFEHSGISLSSASPKPVKIPEIFGPPKNRAERRKNKEKTWKRK
jgi:hypothetical protein